MLGDKMTNEEVDEIIKDVDGDSSGFMKYDEFVKEKLEKMKKWLVFLIYNCFYSNNIHKYLRSSFSNPYSFCRVNILLTGTRLGTLSRDSALNICALVSYIALTAALRLWLAQITMDTSY